MILEIETKKANTSEKQVVVNVVRADFKYDKKQSGYLTLQVVKEDMTIKTLVIWLDLTKKVFTLRSI